MERFIKKGGITLKITGYEELENDYKIGYAENGFVVYGTISKQNTTGFTQPEILQACYKQVRDAISYENNRITEGKSISISYVENTYDIDFIPDIPQASKIVVSGVSFYDAPTTAITNTYTAEVFDQYGDTIDSALLWQASNDATINNGSITIEAVTIKTEISITATAPNGVSGSIGITITPLVVPTLDEVKQSKKDDLLNSRNIALETFTSSALGTLHTYLSRANSVPNDMLLLTSEYSFVTGANYDNASIPWYTEEEGNISHTGAQIIQVYLDARLNVQTQMLHCGTLNSQIDAITISDTVTEADAINSVNAIVW